MAVANQWIDTGQLSYRRRGQAHMEFRWVAQGLGIALRNLRREDGHVYADVHCYVGKARILVRPKANITSDRSIVGLAKSLLEADPKHDWRVFLDSIIVILVDEMDERGEVTMLRPLEDNELPQPMLFEAFVPRGLVSGLVAHGGTGKSLTAIMMALAVATGRQVGPFKPLVQGRVLYADWENEWDLHARRLTRICKGLDIPFPTGQIVHYRARNAKLTSAESEMTEIAYEHEVVLTLLDSIGFAAGGNLNDSDVATSSINALKAIPGTKVMIAHLNKAAVEGTQSRSPSGNTFFWNGPQAVYDLHASEPDVDGAIVFTIYQNKANVGARLKRPLGVRVTFEDDTHGGPITPYPYEVKGYLVGGEGMSERQRILDYLSYVTQPVTADDIAAALYDDPDKSRIDSVTATLRRLRQQGLVEDEGGTRGVKGAKQQWRLFRAQNDFVCRYCGKPATGYTQHGIEVCDEHGERA